MEPHVVENCIEENDGTDRDWLHDMILSGNTWEDIRQIPASGQFMRTLGRLQKVWYEIIKEWENIHPDEVSLHGDIGFNLLHDRFADWACAMRQGEYKSFVGTLDRRAVRDVLFRIWDFLNPVQPQCLAKHHVDERLAIWMCDILYTVLPYERAECLYKMKYVNSIVFGMHWISKLPVHDTTEEHKLIHNEILQYKGKPTMNKRFVEITSFLKRSKFYESMAEKIALIERLLVPTKSPLEPDFCSVDSRTLNQSYDSEQGQRIVVPLREEVNDKIQRATTIEDFCFIYRTTTFMKYHHVLHSLSGGDQPLSDIADQWANETTDLALEDLQMILSFYRKLSDCFMDQFNYSVTKTSVEDKLKIQSISNVLDIALPLARAWAIKTNTAWPEPWMKELYREFSNGLPHLPRWLEELQPRVSVDSDGR